MIRSVDDEVIDEAEEKRAAHAGSHDPSAQLRPPPPDAEADERTGQDDEIHEQRPGGRERHLRALVRPAVDHVDREVDQDDRG